MLELDSSGARVTKNPFDELPLVGGWGRRPFELATLRLQTMVGVSLAEWDALQPTDLRTLTQVGPPNESAGTLCCTHHRAGRPNVALPPRHVTHCAVSLALAAWRARARARRPAHLRVPRRGHLQRVRL